MALQSTGNNLGFRVAPFRAEQESTLTGATLTANAVGESITLIGKMYLEGATGSKTISSSGGTIYCSTGSITWASGATTVRVGIQDVGLTTGIEDTTYDVYADLVPGVETITANTVNAIAMETGSKTISHGDIVAIVIEMTARGGTDQFQIASCAAADGMAFPYCTLDTGTGPAKTTNDVHGIMVKFDDGTYGWIQGTAVGNITSTSVNSGSTPDEYAVLFEFPFPCTISSCSVLLSSVANTDSFEVILYSDPLGTPTVIETLTPDLDVVGGTSGLYFFIFTPTNLTKNTKYAIAIRPTTANSIAIQRLSFGSFSDLRKCLPLGTNFSEGTRTNQTGAFTEATTTVPMIAPYLSKFDDGVQTGGSASNGPVWI